jgi:hypothetical protein
MKITIGTFRDFDKWLLNNPDVSQDDREIIVMFVIDYLKGDII